MPLDEATIIDTYFKPLAGEGAFGFRDDAALVGINPDEELVVTTDMIASGVHFLPGDPPDLVARKALRVNLSDLAAKGATPSAYLLAAAFPRDLDPAWLAAFCDGLARDQELYELYFLGGDTIAFAGGPLLTITAMGRVPKGSMVHRFSARPGDALYVSGTIGDAVAGLAILQGRPGPWDEASGADRERLTRRYRVPEPRVALAPVLREFASAAMDISDGLVGDADKMAETSGLTASIDAGVVPLPDCLRECGQAVLGELLTGGDDYEILAAVPAERERRFVEASVAAGIPVTRIGAMTEGPGIAEVRLHGKAMEFRNRSYLHGRGEGAE